MANDSEAGGFKQTNKAATASFLQDRQFQSWTLAISLSLILVVAYFNTLSRISQAWTTPQYSHGYLVPLFAAVLLWLRREPFVRVPAIHRWWGAALLAVGVVLRAVGTRYVLFTFDNIAIIPCLMGIFIMVGGLRTIRWAGPPIVFLVFMLPWPRILVDGILRPLQTMATACSLYTLQTLGVDAFRVGNRIELEMSTLGVVDACSGLRMLTIFVALAAAIAMIATSRPLWERLIILISAVPIALTVNVIRITLTGLLYNLHIGQEFAHQLVHDWAGYFMMPMALGLLFLELQILSRLIIEVSPQHGLAPAGIGIQSESKR